MDEAITTNDICFWQCGDLALGHKHYSVLIREKGKLLGRLCPDGTTARNVIYGAVLSRATADEIVQEINDNPPFEGITAKRVLSFK